MTTSQYTQSNKTAFLYCEHTFAMCDNRMTGKWLHDHHHFVLVCLYWMQHEQHCNYHPDENRAMVTLLGIYWPLLTCLKTRDNLYTYRTKHEHPHTLPSKNPCLKVCGATWFIPDVTIFIFSWHLGLTLDPVLNFHL
jgi:hypothetical protein